jgi:uncharacterized RDD family membrane protein YckC
MDRKDIGAWLSGPITNLGNTDKDFRYPGNRLGLPAQGPGSVAGIGRRVLAFFLDYFASMAIAHLAAPHLAYLSNPFRLLALEIMFGEIVLFTVLLGSSFGQRLLGVQVVGIDLSRLTIVRVVVRTILIFLVVPAAIWDRDGRGFHDRAVGSITVRTR